MLVYYPLTIILIFFFYKYSLWNKWKKLNSLVSYRTNNPLLIYWYSIQLIFQTLWLYILQYTNTSLKQCGKNKYEISYTINGKIYKIISKKQRGPSPILQISNELDVDVTQDILPFLGPGYDWHCNTFTPFDFGYNSLIFEMHNGNGYTFSCNDEIKID